MGRRGKCGGCGSEGEGFALSSCSHFLCQHCLQNKLGNAQSQLSCPICRISIDTGDLIELLPLISGDPEKSHDPNSNPTTRMAEKEEDSSFSLSDSETSAASQLLLRCDCPCGRNLDREKTRRNTQCGHIICLRCIKTELEVGRCCRGAEKVLCPSPNCFDIPLSKETLTSLKENYQIQSIKSGGGESWNWERLNGFLEEVMVQLDEVMVIQGLREEDVTTESTGSISMVGEEEEEGEGEDLVLHLTASLATDPLLTTFTSDKAYCCQPDDTLRSFVNRIKRSHGLEAWTVKLYKLSSEEPWKPLDLQNSNWTVGLGELGFISGDRFCIAPEEIPKGVTEPATNKEDDEEETDKSQDDGLDTDFDAPTPSTKSLSLTLTLNLT